ncbi:segregation/condensation protein A [Alloscardovia theropitheci]|uniref:Segregation and condensation protein A n=1 Tax=Alloscardovia theropitheci TaxID=2496842 RepID=A0A4R0QW98_9BIFI|nr:segregation/condensation protein A [Alloscardovia theropitheci]TCD54637.1 segregation/condensation protein A [Alloscardovia theropitheci]
MAEVFNVNLKSYQGPFDVLLNLLSQRQLELTQISLSEITEEFVDYVKHLDMARDADQVSSFIDVASILVEAKSASLIPRDDENSDLDINLESLQERDLLFARLLQYRAFKQAGEDFRQRIAANSGRFAHPGVLMETLQSLMPQLEWSMPADDFAKLAAEVISNAPASEVSIRQLHVPLVDLRAQAAVVRDKLRAAGNKKDITFSQLIADATHKIEIVARFLALLAFFKQGVVQFKQDEPFDELHVRWLSDNDTAENTDVVAISEGDFA